MNLQDIINYRTKCLIHSDEDLDSVAVYDNFYTKTTDKGLSIFNDKSCSKLRFEFNYDGTWKSTDKNNTIVIHRMCSICVKQPVYKNMGLGITKLDDILNNCYFYNFILSGIDNDFYAKLMIESIKYVKDDKFYHMDTDIKKKQGNCKIGNCSSNLKLYEMLKDSLSLKIPNLNMDKIKNTDQLIDKLKLYNLFS